MSVRSLIRSLTRSRVVAIGTWPATLATRHDRVPQGKNGSAPRGAGKIQIRARCARETGAVMSLDTNESWPGFSPEESLQWARALLHHSPQPLRASIKAQMSEARDTRHPGRRTGLAEQPIGPAPAASLLSYTARSSRFCDQSSRSRSHRILTIAESPTATTFQAHPFEPELWHEWPRLVLNGRMCPGNGGRAGVSYFAKSR